MVQKYVYEYSIGCGCCGDVGNAERSFVSFCRRVDCDVYCLLKKERLVQDNDELVVL